MPRLTDSEITEMIAGLPDWSVLEESGFGSISDITGDTSSIEELFVDIDSSKSTKNIL